MGLAALSRCCDRERAHRWQQPGHRRGSDPRSMSVLPARRAQYQASKNHNQMQFVSALKSEEQLGRNAEQHEKEVLEEGSCEASWVSCYPRRLVMSRRCLTRTTSLGSCRSSPDPDFPFCC